MGRARACSSPSNPTTESASAASGGTKRRTVPARPQSTVASGAGAMRPLTVRSEPGPSTSRPRVRSAPIIRAVARLRSAPVIVEVPCPCAAAGPASSNARLVCDFEPGTVTLARTGALACGAVHGSVLLTWFILPSRRASWVAGTMEAMCGRFAVTTDPAKLAEKIKAIDEATGTAPNAQAPNYTVAPTATIATVVTRHTEPDDDPTRRVRLMRWGLIPPWVKAGPDGAPEGKGPLLLNARADKVTSSPAFRSSAKWKR